MKVIGLAFINLTALKVVTVNKQMDLKVYPSDGWEKWREDAKGRRMAVAVVEDRKHFRNALDSGAMHLIVLTDYDWLTRRGVTCLDAAKKGDNLTIKSVTPDQIKTSLLDLPDYQLSENDKWISKGNPEGRCAGCKQLSDCGHDPKVMTKRPCETQWEVDSTENSYRSYSLSHLIHLALGSANEDALLLRPQEFWKATFDFALGNISRSDWIAQYGRALRTAGTPKNRLQDIALWVKRYGSALKAGEVKSPLTKGDQKMVEALVNTPE
jgi:hypothetical protein